MVKGAVTLKGSADSAIANADYVRNHQTVLILPVDPQPSSQLLDSNFKDILLGQIESSAVFEVQFTSLNVDTNLPSNASLCVEVKAVKKLPNSTRPLSDTLDLHTNPSGKIVIPINQNNTLDANSIVIFAIQARLKQGCANSTAYGFIPSISENNITFTPSNVQQVLRDPIQGFNQSIPINLNVSSPAGGQPAQGNLVWGSVDYTEILKVNLRPEKNTDLSKVKLKLLFPDNNPDFPRILSRFILMDFVLQDRGTTTNINGGVMFFGGNNEKEFSLNGYTLRPDRTYTLTVRAKQFMSEADAQLRPSFRMQISNYKNSADTVLITGTPTITSNRFTTVPAPASPLPPVAPPPSAGPAPTGTVLIQNSAAPNIIDITDPTNVIREVFKFRVNTVPESNINTIAFKLKTADMPVAANHLTYFLFDADTNQSISASPIINADAKTVSFRFSPPADIAECEPANTAFCRNRHPLPTGKILSLRVMPNVNFREYIIGRTIRIGFDSVNNISLWGDNEHFSSDQQGSMWGATTYTFSNSAAAPAADEIQREPPPVVEVCNAAHICAHSIVADTIPAATFSSGAATTAPVLGFTISPGRDAMLSMVKARLDTTLLDAAPGARIKAQLVIVNTEGVERQLFRPIAPVNNVFTFSGFNQMLATGHPTHFLIKVKIEDDPEANAIQHFKLLINPGDIYLNRYHSVTLPNGLASIAMEIPANDQQDVPGSEVVPGADGEDIPDPQNDVCSDGEHPNEAGECVPNGSEYCDPDSQHFDIILRQCVQNEIVDACPQTPDVIDREIPAGGCTVPPPPPAVKPDLCINIPDKQETMPTGKMGDGVGGCVPIPVVIPDKTCTEQGKFDYSGPDRAGLTKGVCIPCPTNLFIQSNMTCFIVDSGVKKTDKTASGSGAGTKKGSGSSSGSGSTAGASNELRGAALEGAGSLGGSQRLIRMPERGNTGPDVSIYLSLAGLAPAAAYAFRKLRK